MRSKMDPGRVVPAIQPAHQTGNMFYMSFCFTTRKQMKHCIYCVSVYPFLVHTRQYGIRMINERTLTLTASLRHSRATITTIPYLSESLCVCLTSVALVSESISIVSDTGDSGLVPSSGTSKHHTHCQCTFRVYIGQCQRNPQIIRF